MNAATLQRVLCPDGAPETAPAQVYRQRGEVPEFVLHSEAFDIAARELHGHYLRGVRAVHEDLRGDYQGETWLTGVEAEEAVPDDLEAAIVGRMFERLWAGIGGVGRVRPTTLRCQVEMQMSAILSARRLRLMSMRQAALV